VPIVEEIVKTITFHMSMMPHMLKMKVRITAMMVIVKREKISMVFLMPHLYASFNHI